MFKFNQKFPVAFTADTPNGTSHVRFPDIIRPEASHIRCVTCKYPLAPASAIVSFSSIHNPFGPKCSHFFLCNAMSWMKLDRTSPGGKIYCPNQGCGWWLGEYCFLGVQCDCGEISSPGMALLRRVPGTQAMRTEFKRVQEEGDDADYVSSSQEEEESDDDEIEEDPNVEGNVNGDDDSDKDEDWEEVKENAHQRDHGEALEAGQKNVRDLSTSTTPISLPNDRLARPSSTAPTLAQNDLTKPRLSNTVQLPVRPPNLNFLRFPRPPNPHNLPLRPSRLRQAVIPRSTPSSTTSSENGDSDDEGGLPTIGEQEESVLDWDEFLAQNPAIAVLFREFETHP